jgi:hypothetical protein
MRTSRQPSPLQIMIDQKQPENVEYLNSFGRTMTNNEIYLQEIKSRVAMAIAAFKKKTLLTSKMDLNLRKKLAKCYIWSVVCMVLELGHFGK